MATRTSTKAGAEQYPAQPVIRDSQHRLPARVPRRIARRVAASLAAVALGAAGAVATYLLRRKRQQESSLRHRVLKTLRKGYENASDLAGKASSKAADLAAHEGRDLAQAAVSTGTHLAQQGGRLAAKTAGSVRDFAAHQGTQVVTTGQALAAEGGKVAAKGYLIGRQAAEDTVHVARKRSKTVMPLLVGLALAAAAAYVEKLASKPAPFGSNGHESVPSESAAKATPRRRTTGKRTAARKRSTAKSE